MPHNCDSISRNSEIFHGVLCTVVSQNIVSIKKWYSLESLIGIRVARIFDQSEGGPKPQITCNDVIRKI